MSFHPQSVPIASYDDASQAAPRAPVYDYAESLICRTPEANDVELPNEDLRDVLANYTAQTRMVRLVFERERQALADRDAALDQQTRSLVDSRFEIADARTALEAEKAKFALQREGEEREYQGRLTDLEDREHAQTFADPRLNDPLPHFLEAIDGVKADFADMIECLEIKVTDNTDTMAEIHDAVHYNNDMTNPDGLAAQVGTVSDEIQRLADAVLALNRARAKDTRRILNAIAGHGEGIEPVASIELLLTILQVHPLQSLCDSLAAPPL